MSCQRWDPNLHLISSGFDVIEPTLLAPGLQLSAEANPDQKAPADQYDDVCR